MNGKGIYRRRFLILMLLAEILFIIVYTYALQINYSSKTLRASVEDDIDRSDWVYRSVSNYFTREDFENIDSVGDMGLARYDKLQEHLNDLRSVKSIRYLYTAKADKNGNPIYLIDGLPLDAEDFAYPGTYIESEMVPYINRALSGETVYSQDIIDTTWGHIFTACYPIRAHDGSNDIIGALCIEMDMEAAYNIIRDSNNSALCIAAAAAAFSVLIIIYMYGYARKLKKKDDEHQQKLMEAAEAAEAANKAKSAFLFNMSHDLRTPMNAILGYSELAERHIDDHDKLKEYMHNVRISGQNLLQLIDNVLEIARIENNKVTIQQTAVKSGSCFDTCITMFRTAADEKQQKINVEKHVTYPYIYIDEGRMSEIIINILSNAVKYTGKGGSISCSYDQLESDRQGFCTVRIRIKDNGIGISDEFKAHIFEDFARERNSTISGVQGTGLGMGIVKKLIDLMDGKIELESKIGEGSEFTVYIPARIAAEDDIKIKRMRVHITGMDTSRIRVLLAEDNELNADIAVQLLAEEGIKTERAVNGVECISMLQKAPVGYYSLILMDIQMPVMDGYTAAQNIRKLEDSGKADIPIIAMTANAFNEDRIKAIESGMDDHVAKPIDMNQLMTAIDKQLKKAAAESEN